MSKSKLPIPHRIDVVRATRAENDEQILKSWLDNLNSLKPPCQHDQTRHGGTEGESDYGQHNYVFHGLKLPL
jgi:hypothetical protein